MLKLPGDRRPTQIDLLYTRADGDVLQFDLTRRGAPEDANGWTYVMTVAVIEAGAVGAELFSVDGSVDPETTNQVNFAITPSDLDHDPGNYVYDIQRTNVANPNLVKTIVRGILSIEAGVTGEAT